MSGTVLFRRPPRKHRRFNLLGEVKIQDQDRVLYIALPRLNQKVQYICMYNVCTYIIRTATILFIDGDGKTPLLR